MPVKTIKLEEMRKQVSSPSLWISVSCYVSTKLRDLSMAAHYVSSPQYSLFKLGLFNKKTHFHQMNTRATSPPYGVNPGDDPFPSLSSDKGHFNAKRKTVELPLLSASRRNNFKVKFILFVFVSWFWINILWSEHWSVYLLTILLYRLSLLKEESMVLGLGVKPRPSRLMKHTRRNSLGLLLYFRMFS